MLTRPNSIPLLCALRCTALQLWTILTFSIVGTLAAAIIIGLLLHAFGEAGEWMAVTFMIAMADDDAEIRLSIA